MISVILFLLSLMLVFLPGIFQLYSNMVEEKVYESVSMNIESAQVKMDNIQTDALRFLTDDVVIAALEESSYSLSINPKLNFMRSMYQEEIANLLLYGMNSFVYKTDNLSVSEISPFDVFTGNHEIETFLASSDISTIVVLHQDVAIKNISYVLKITQEDTLLGLLVVNLDIEYLFSEYFGFSSSTDIELIENFVQAENRLYYPSSLFEMSSDYSSEWLIAEPHLGYSDFYGEFTSRVTFPKEGIALVSVFDTTQLQRDFLRIFALSVTAFVFTVVGSFFIIRRLTDNLIVRLDKLEKKMDSATEVLHD